MRFCLDRLLGWRRQKGEQAAGATAKVSMSDEGTHRYITGEFLVRELRQCGFKR